MWFTTGMTKPQPTAAPRRAAVATALPVSTTTTYSAQAVSSSNDSKLEEIVQDSDTDIIGTGGGLYSSAPPGGGEPGGSSSNNPSSAGGESPSLMHRSHLRVTPPVKSHLASSRSLTAAGNPRSGPSSPALVGFGRAGLSVRCVLLFLFLASAASVALLGQWAASPDCSPISGITSAAAVSWSSRDSADFALRGASSASSASMSAAETISPARAGSDCLREGSDCAAGTKSTDAGTDASAASTRSTESDMVLIVTAVPPTACPAPRGDHRNLLSIKNKMDYAALHGYSVYVGTKKDSVLEGGPWNKVALLKRLLMNPGTKRFSWLMWIDMDAIVEEMEFEIPVSRYRDVDLVIWGNETELLKHKDAKTGLNTGVFLLRNSKWSRNFLAEVTRFGENFFNISGALTEAEQRLRLQREFPRFEYGLYDQNGFAYVMAFQPELASGHYYLENDHIINGYWNDTSKYGQSVIINHFSGCQFCSGLNKESKTQCQSAYLRSYSRANKKFEDAFSTSVTL